VGDEDAGMPAEEEDDSDLNDLVDDAEELGVPRTSDSTARCNCDAV